MALSPVPKQPRTPRVLRRTERRAARQAELARQSATRRRYDVLSEKYGYPGVTDGDAGIRHA